MIPNVSKGWSISPDGLVYRFDLRKGMKWSDGVAFTSDDFVWHFENVISNLELNPTRDGEIGWSGVQVDSVTAVDDLTVNVTLRERKDGFLDSLANYTTGGWTLHGRIADGMYGPTHFLKTIHRDFASDKAAYDKKVADAGYEAWTTYFKDLSSPLKRADTPVISPWKMTSPITAELYEWERNPYYWAVDPAGNQLPYMDRVSMTLTGDKEVLNLKAAAGEIDFQHRHIDMAKVPVFKQNAEKSNIAVQFWGSHGAQAGLVINMSYGVGENLNYEADPEIQKWINNFDFRKALSIAIDREKINEVMFLGSGVPNQGTFAKGHPFYPGDEVALAYTDQDTDEANKILDGIGLDKKDGAGFRLRTDGSGDVLGFEMMYIAEYFVAYDKLAELLAEDFGKIGIKTYLKPLDVSVIAERRNNNDIVFQASGVMSARWPNLLDRWHNTGAAYRNWYVGGRDVYAAAGVAAEPTDANIKRLGELADAATKKRYEDRGPEYIEGQTIFINNLYSIGAVGGTPAFNGVIVKKNYMKNVPDVAPNQSPLQNPGIGRTPTWFMEGGKNDQE